MAVRTFALISEAEARTIEPGSTVELERGGHVTPLAQDTLRERRVTVVPKGTVDATLPADLAPAANPTRIAIGSDHTGLKLKAALIDHLRKQGRAVTDMGTLTRTRWITRTSRAPWREGRGPRGSRRRHRHRWRGPGLGDRREQGARRARGDVLDADAGALRA